MWKPATRQITGTNDVPLGQRRRFGPAPAEDAPAPQLAQPSPSAYPRAQVQDDSPGKRGRDDSPATGDPKVDPNAPRKRRSRWGEAKTEIPGLPTAISAAGVSQAQLDNYAIHLRLEEINRKLRLNDFVPPERERSPSPPPTYDGQGRRTNTREVRYRKKLEDERIKLVDRAMKNDPNFRPPVEYHQQKRSQRPSDKVYIPVKEFPEINFFGLLVGPRGNSLKKMERESGAKISIRGKGSVKEGKARPDQYADDAEEDLHCLVIADSEDKVIACVKMINKVIETVRLVQRPPPPLKGKNDHKRNQLRELAALNGTLRDDENQICQNCGGVGHRKYDCPEQRNFTANIICRVCGSAGHMARDCTVNKDPNAQANWEKAEEQVTLARLLGMRPAWVMTSLLVVPTSLHGVVLNPGSSPLTTSSRVIVLKAGTVDTEVKGEWGGYAAGGYQQPQDYNYAAYYQGQYAQQLS
ncbi:hypothetical protein NLJ89_g3259 [Agrocybe chaxingu]|uniref:Branchpoint-bridging protein n=1 Tax=Agrocybe chaxingu TaxID=84603 RepID=A0A9W8K573_9AGAR|nr:hypothetical protein NLJ89_g3259 [Agrocybe chaxingu]